MLFRSPACVLGISHIHIGNNVHDATVGLLREAFVLAAVAGFHMEDRDVEALGADYAEARVGVAENQDCIRFSSHHQFI